MDGGPHFWFPLPTLDVKRDDLTRFGEPLKDTDRLLVGKATSGKCLPARTISQQLRRIYVRYATYKLTWHHHHPIVNEKSKRDTDLVKMTFPPAPTTSIGWSTTPELLIFD